LPDISDSGSTAAITLALVHNAVLLITTSILQLLAHCALEKAFAAFAAATRQAKYNITRQNFNTLL